MITILLFDAFLQKCRHDLKEWLPYSYVMTLDDILQKAASAHFENVVAKADKVDRMLIVQYRQLSQQQFWKFVMRLCDVSQKEPMIVGEVELRPRIRLT